MRPGPVYTRTVKGTYAYLACSSGKAKAGCTYRLTKYDRVDRAFIDRAPSFWHSSPQGTKEETLTAA